MLHVPPPLFRKKTHLSCILFLLRTTLVSSDYPHYGILCLFSFPTFFSAFLQSPLHHPCYPLQKNTPWFSLSEYFPFFLYQDSQSYRSSLTKQKQEDISPEKKTCFLHVFFYCFFRRPPSRLLLDLCSSLCMTSQLTCGFDTKHVRTSNSAFFTQET